VLDLVIKNGTVVFPNRGVRNADLGVRDGKIVSISEQTSEPARAELDATGKHVFPGVVDSHFHAGIYRPLQQDARSESASAVAGGVTSILIYYRAGRHNLLADTSAAIPAGYGELFPQLLEESSRNFHCDYGYHLAPVTTRHVAEIPELVERYGVRTFKFYMHYRGVDPRQMATPPGEKEILFSDTPYDLGFLQSIMRQVSEVNTEGRGVRVSVHAENPAIIRENMARVRRESGRLGLNPLEAYSRARPADGERLAILEASELARQTGAPLNVLHVSSATALDTIRQVRREQPGLDIIAEATVHHLTLTTDSLPGPEARVNPPIRSADDREALWVGIRDDSVATVVSDHAAAMSDCKQGDIWEAWYGFGGTELLLPAMITEGHLERGIPLERIAGLLSMNPARIHGVPNKGDIALGYDADLAVCDVSQRRRVDHRELHSAQDFSPFDGLDLAGWVETTVLRGSIVYQRGQLAGEPIGAYLKR
jgi:dihydropyrimidinase/allantoinase